MRKNKIKMMKKLLFILMFLSSIVTVESPFVDIPYKITIKPKEIIPGEYDILATSSCYVPPWTVCPDGYECVNYYVCHNHKI